jgi:hypothetical protein
MDFNDADPFSFLSPIQQMDEDISPAPDYILATPSMPDVFFLDPQKIALATPSMPDAFFLDPQKIIAPTPNANFSTQLMTDEILQEGVVPETILLPESPSLHFSPLSSFIHLDSDGFLPREHRKYANIVSFSFKLFSHFYRTNHAAVCSMLRRALFNDELVRFAVLNKVTSEELHIIVENAWNLFAKHKIKYGKQDREYIRDYVYQTYRAGVPIPPVPLERRVPPIDTIYASVCPFLAYFLDLL